MAFFYYLIKSVEEFFFCQNVTMADAGSIVGIVLGAIIVLGIKVACCWARRQQHNKMVYIVERPVIVPVETTSDTKAIL